MHLDPGQGQDDKGGGRFWGLFASSTFMYFLEPETKMTSFIKGEIQSRF